MLIFKNLKKKTLEENEKEEIKVRCDKGFDLDDKRSCLRHEKVAPPSSEKPQHVVKDERNFGFSV